MNGVQFTEQLAEGVAAVVFTGTALMGVLLKLTSRYVTKIAEAIIDRKLTETNKVLKDISQTLHNTNERMAKLETAATGEGLRVRGVEHDPERRGWGHRWQD